MIDRTQFNYSEIAVPQEQIDWLTDNGWFGDLTHASCDIAGVLTKDALLEALAGTAVFRAPISPSLNS